MMKDLSFKIPYLLICLLVYLFIAQTTIANSLSLSLDPSLIEISALPPTVATTTLSIQNKSDNQVQLQIRITPFRPRLENGELEYLNSQDSFLTQNIQILDGTVSVEGITLAPRQEKKLTLNVNIPKDTNVSRLDSPSSSSARRADYYFSIIFVSQSTESPTSNTSSNQLGIASNVILSVGKKETPDAILEEFSSGLFYESGPVPFKVRIKNKGTHFIKPTGKILIKNMFGQSIGKLDLVSVNILSQSIRAISNTTYMQELRSQENSKSKSKPDLDFQHPKALWKEDFLLGLYTATLNITLSDEGPSFTKSIHFFAFPFQGLIVIVIVLISTIIIVNRVRSRMYRRPWLGKK